MNILDLLQKVKISQVFFSHEGSLIMSIELFYWDYLLRTIHITYYHIIKYFSELLHANYAISIIEQPHPTFNIH